MKYKGRFIKNSCLLFCILKNQSYYTFIIYFKTYIITMNYHFKNKTDVGNVLLYVTLLTQ